MKEQFDAAQISKVIDQALVYQCACPAQVCRAIFELRELYEYQMNCVNDSANKRAGAPNHRRRHRKVTRGHGGVPEANPRY